MKSLKLKVKSSNVAAGFTLIEAVVSITIFLFIIGAVVSIFISVVQNEASILAEQQALNQMSYAMEYMSKALRVAKPDPTGECMEDDAGGVGYVYLLTRPDLSTGLYQGIKFINQSDNDACEEFYLDSNDQVLKVLLNNTNSAAAVPLSSAPVVDAPSFIIKDIAFAINGQIASKQNFTSPQGVLNDGESQPRITIVIHVEIPENGQQVLQTIQTTISERNLNVAPATNQ